MISLLLAIIYLAFISLGLPDSLLGAAWPIMHQDLSVSLSYAGMLSMIISGGTIISSIFSDALTRKLGTGLVTAISVLLTACALFGFSASNSFIILCAFGIPYGLGAGTIDAALNNYVALHYSSKHMSWLHCFWGVGASISPYIMGYALSSGLGWRKGYGIISIIQIVLTIVLFLSLPLWQERTAAHDNSTISAKPIGLIKTLKIKGIFTTLLIFFSYCALESTAGLWISSYLVDNRSMTGESAAFFGSLFYLGITIGRFVCGFITDKLGDKIMIRIGTSIMLLGVILILLPLNISVTALTGIIITGIGAAPVYPSLIHATPSHFGKENSQAVIGIQMASAYIGTTFMPPLFGLLAEHISIALYPIYLLLFLILMIVFSEKLNKVVAK